MTSAGCRARCRVRPGSEFEGCTVELSLAPNLTGAEAIPAAGATARARAARAATRPVRRAIFWAVALRVICSVDVDLVGAACRGNRFARIIQRSQGPQGWTRSPLLSTECGRSSLRYAERTTTAWGY